MMKNIKKLGELTLVKRKKEIEIKKHRLEDLFWECTLSCNMHCKHCGSNALSKKYEGELTTQEIKDTFKNIAEKMDATKILINVTGGEPLLRKDLCEVMRYTTRELAFRRGMTTNGFLLYEENIEKLKQANMETISISLDGIGKTHDTFRGLVSYDRILENIKKLKKANFLKHLQITTVFSKLNINELEKIYEVVADLGIDSRRLGSMDPIGRGNKNTNLLLDAQETKKVLDFILKNKDKKLKLTYACPSFLGLEYEKEVRGYYFYCKTGINVASILYNGDIFVCPNVPRIPNLIQGNVRNDDFVEVWNTKFAPFRSSTRTTCDTCKKCDSRDFCLGGAFHTWNFEDNIQNRCVYQMLHTFTS